MLEVRLCRPGKFKLKILGGGKFEYYKSTVVTTKRGVTKFLKFNGGKAKRRGVGGHVFWLKFSGGKNLGGNYVNKHLIVAVATVSVESCFQA